MKKLATSVFTFEDLRKNGVLYIDKTKYIWKLLSSGENSYFLSRPRRFGKSLLLSTFKAYFEGKKDLFAGLDIEKLKTDEWETYPVIHLDLASGSSRESYEALIQNWKQQLSKSFVSLGIEPVDGSPAVMLDALIEGTYRKYNKEVVILIDEYDKPVLDSMFEPYVGEVMGVMSDFYQKLKSANDIERFVFITGVTKFAHVSLFSGSNNPTDLTRNKDYATMLGYTEAELRENFAEYIDRTAEELEMGRGEMLDAIKRWYNGTRFVRATESVYNPVSVGKFFVNRDFDNYWIETGTSRIMLEKMRRTPFGMRDLVNVWSRDLAGEKYELKDVSVTEMAIQTGYLSIAEWKRADRCEWKVRYDFPNKEIRDCWYSNIINLTTGYDRFGYEALMDKMCDALDEGDLKKFMEVVGRFFSGIPYENAGEISEGYFRNQLHTLFTLFGIPNQCEVQQASQRADIVAQTRKMAVVFEVKMLPKEESGKDDKIDALLDEAEAQARKRGYAESYRNESEIVRTVAVVFDEGTRKMGKWREVR